LQELAPAYSQDMRCTDTFDLTSNVDARAYETFVNDPKHRILSQQDFFAVVGNGPEEPASPTVIRLVDYEVVTRHVGFKPPIC
jgi:hypothetical protein